LTWDLSADAVVRFAAAFGVPDLVVPWLDRFFEEADVPLVLALADGPCAPPRLAQRLPGLSNADIERAHHRGILDRAADGTVSMADFHARFEIWAIFEGWKDVPAEVRTALNEWEVDQYEERKRPQIDALRAGREPDPGLENSEYLLLHEAEALLDRVDRVYLWPCNCRSMMGECSKPVNTCLRFTNERGVGWEISRERAVEIVRQANKAGLMQTGEVVETDGRVSGAICNCCADCCYPHLVSARLGAEKLWPRSRYLARHLTDECTACGRCARRCPFGAFAASTREAADAEAAHLEITFHAEFCRGCGVCSTGCPADAIVMDPLPGNGSVG
jgi:Pyruvate/2-oxoacid:ferredoxin oxidoreductase delta subunit